MGSPSDQKYYCRNYIGGRWLPSLDGKEFTLFEFEDPTKPIDTFPDSNLKDLKKALGTTSRVYGEFQKTPLNRRGEIFSLAAKLLETRKPKLVDLVTKEVGRPEFLATSQINTIGGTLKFFAGEFLDLEFINNFSELTIPMAVKIQKRDQAYLVALNHSHLISAAFVKIIPILWSGNPVIFLPHEKLAASATALIDILVEAGFKEYPGALNLLHTTV